MNLEKEKVGVSVVAPMHNEEGNAKHLYQAIKNAVDPLGIGYEIIFVNDASSDRTLEVLKKIQKEDKNFHYCDLHYNAGENWALLAGVSVAKGETIVTIDGDHQNDPKFIPALLSELDRGYHVVSGWRRDRAGGDRKSTRLNSSHSSISYAVFCLKKRNSEKEFKVLVALIQLQTLLTSSTTVR